VSRSEARRRSGRPTRSQPLGSAPARRPTRSKLREALKLAATAGNTLTIRNPDALELEIEQGRVRVDVVRNVRHVHARVALAGQIELLALKL
jgi:hypothetical protein